MYNLYIFNVIILTSIYIKGFTDGNKFDYLCKKNKNKFRTLRRKR